MNDTNSVSATYGRVNFTNHSLSLTTLKVDPPFARKAANIAGKVYSRTSHPASNRSSTHGGFTASTVALKEGSVILIQAQRSRRGSLVNQAAIFVRLRNTAPMLKIDARLPGDPESILGESVNAFLGRGDILSKAELKVLCIDVPRKWAQAYMSPEEAVEAFVIEEVAAGTGARPLLVAVATESGVQVKSVTEAAPRRIRLRR